MAGFSSSQDVGTPRSPSPVDRREGAILLGGYPRGQPTPRSYTYTEHDPMLGKTVIKTTTEDCGDIVITVITKIQYRRADPADDSNAPSPAQVNVEETAEVDERPSAPHPRQLKPFNAEKYYVVFAGTRVGIFGRWFDVLHASVYGLLTWYIFSRNSEALSYVEGVRGAKHHSYKTWNEAILEYSRAYHNKKEGWNVEVLDGPVSLNEEDPEITRGLTFTQSSRGTGVQGR
ncbi:hypothetical protein VNI00_016896 [Paramarasmius palmivorus]|uniref:Uncharacterized protein n=1 Tax=Paramarasmius palmivorus TaxID=297713 RepID=A0AAW0BA34_9AGAR